MLRLGLRSCSPWCRPVPGVRSRQLLCTPRLPPGTGASRRLLCAKPTLGGGSGRASSSGAGGSGSGGSSGGSSSDGSSGGSSSDGDGGGGAKWNRYARMRQRPSTERDDYSIAAGMLAVALGALGLAYAAVPLYRVFCQTTGFGGTPKRHDGGGEDDGYDLPKDPASLPGNRPLRVTFNTDVSPELPWHFKPVQKHVDVLAGQTSLAFFECTNNSSEPIIGVATYNVVPNEAGAYFNKIQCFCFDEQRLLPGETVPPAAPATRQRPLPVR